MTSGGINTNIVVSVIHKVTEESIKFDVFN